MTTAQASQITKRYIDEIEFEAAYGIPRRTLQKSRLLRRGPAARKFGKGVRYEVAEIERWIKSLPIVGGGAAA